jgi:hypothetical protein
VKLNTIMARHLCAQRATLAQSHEGAHLTSGVHSQDSPQPHVGPHAQLSTLDAQAQDGPQLQDVVLLWSVMGTSWVVGFNDR